MKRVSGKRAKTDADFEELARLEFLGGLYLHNGEPCLPGEVIEAALVEAAARCGEVSRRKLASSRTRISQLSMTALAQQTSCGLMSGFV
jgi:hypothetical protein